MKGLRGSIARREWVEDGEMGVVCRGLGGRRRMDGRRARGRCRVRDKAEGVRTIDQRGGRYR